jgi:hypothetical protein
MLVLENFSHPQNIVTSYTFNGQKLLKRDRERKEQDVRDKVDAHNYCFLVI